MIREAIERIGSIISGRGQVSKLESYDHIGDLISQFDNLVARVGGINEDSAKFMGMSLVGSPDSDYPDFLERFQQHLNRRYPQSYEIMMNGLREAQQVHEAEEEAALSRRPIFIQDQIRKARSAA
ncbi:hypothetical protein HYS94_05655 [Candidatus Daviesbacteria bacterium]|nr:hypothetical protein [Candidatus Daviesbacteria bacterium]